MSLALLNLALEFVQMEAQHSLALEIGFGVDALVMDDVALKLFDSLGHSFHSRLRIVNWDEDKAE